MKYESVHDPTHFYFVTSTIVNWKHLFHLPNYAQIVLNSLKWLREHERMKLFAFVVMPNHVHTLIKPLGEFETPDIVHAFESYTAHEILKLLRKEQRRDLLDYFRQCAANHMDRKHNFWQDSLDENVYTEPVLLQKVEYIHNNPVSKKWALAADRADYPYSSARFYDRGEEPIIPVDDVREYLR